MSFHFCWGYRWFDSVGNVSLAHLKAWMQQPIHVLMLTMFNLFCPQLQFSHFILDNESLAALNCFYSWISPVTISQSSMAPVCARTTDMDMQLKKFKKCQSCQYGSFQSNSFPNILELQPQELFSHQFGTTKYRHVCVVSLVLNNI